MALVATIVGASSDEDRQLVCEAQIAKDLMLLYDDVSRKGAGTMSSVCLRSPATRARSPECAVIEQGRLDETFVKGERA
jgi:hypothetical protein